MTSQPLQAFDAAFFLQGYRLLCGVDEAGRGPLAGPVVAAAVLFNPDTQLPGINDSKRLTARRRETLFDLIRQQAAAFGIGTATVAEINRLNILQATFLAMRRAVDQLELKPHFVLVDGRDFPVFTHRGERLPGTAVVKGDGKSQVIAAASVLAKVHRDRLMRQAALEYPLYGFDRHKGYGTAEHRRLIMEHGPCPLHRTKFIRSLIQQEQELIST